MRQRPTRSTLFPYTTLFRSRRSARRTHTAVRRSPPCRRSRHLSLHHRQSRVTGRSEEHTSELQSQFHLVCRLLLEKKKKKKKKNHRNKKLYYITLIYKIYTI